MCTAISLFSRFKQLGKESQKNYIDIRKYKNAYYRVCLAKFEFCVGRVTCNVAVFVENFQAVVKTVYYGNRMISSAIWNKYKHE